MFDLKSLLRMTAPLRKFLEIQISQVEFTANMHFHQGESFQHYYSEDHFTLTPLLKGSSWGQENDSFEVVKMTLELTVWYRFSYLKAGLKALSHAAIFLAICSAILLLGDVKLANTCFHASSELKTTYFQFQL